MDYCTTNTYKMKREIANFSKFLSKGQSAPERKFCADMTYGILASKSCLLTDIADSLHENIRKKNTVDRLSKHLENGIPLSIKQSYCRMVKKYVPKEPVIHIDDSDVTKPNGHKFQNLGIVRDGSASTNVKSVYTKGYAVTEACVLSSDNHPISIFSHIHSANESEFESANNYTFKAIQQGVAMFKKATFVMDRGYDSNKIFLYLDKLNQDYVIRLKSNRKLMLHNKWYYAPELCNRRKGKIRMDITYKGKTQTAYISHVKVQVTAKQKTVYLVLVYGISENPMMLLTNKNIKSKEDVIHIAKLYFSRWKIEEYFRCKKQVFQFENFRVRKLIAINALNFYISVCMLFLDFLSLKSIQNKLKVSVMYSANAIKGKVSFNYYRLAKGIANILSYAKEGIRLWFKPLWKKCRQLRLPMLM